jgi:hypothetical protein
VPFEDRPLEVWVKAFIKSIYSPTIYTYKKRNDYNWLDLDFTKLNKEKVDEADKPIKNENLFVVGEELRDGSKSYITREKSKYNNDVALARKKLSEDVLREEVEGIEEKIELIDKGKTSPGMVATNVTQNSQTKTEEVETNKEVVDDWRENKVDLNLKRERLEATGKAVFGTIPMPDRPDIANVIVGMATNADGKIVDGVIVEIQDEHGIPTRVIKTNSLGQFKISTPLANGRYLIIAEKDGYIFDRVNIDLTGKIIDPVRIIAHN